MKIWNKAKRRVWRLSGGSSVMFLKEVWIYSGLGSFCCCLRVSAGRFFAQGPMEAAGKGRFSSNFLHKSSHCRIEKLALSYCVWGPKQASGWPPCEASLWCPAGFCGWFWERGTGRVPSAVCCELLLEDILLPCVALYCLS